MSASTHSDAPSHGEHGHGDAPAGPVLVSVSDRHPRVRTSQGVRPRGEEPTSLAATAKGLGITIKHFARNLFLPMRKAAARSKAGAPTGEDWRNEIETVQ